MTDKSKNETVALGDIAEISLRHLWQIKERDLIATPAFFKAYSALAESEERNPFAEEDTILSKPFFVSIFDQVESFEYGNAADNCMNIISVSSDSLPEQRLQLRLCVDGENKFVDLEMPAADKRDQFDAVLRTQYLVIRPNGKDSDPDGLKVFLQFFIQNADWKGLKRQVNIEAKETRVESAGGSLPAQLKRAGGSPFYYSMDTLLECLRGLSVDLSYETEKLRLAARRIWGRERWEKDKFNPSVFDDLRANVIPFYKIRMTGLWGRDSAITANPWANFERYVFLVFMKGDRATLRRALEPASSLWTSLIPQIAEEKDEEKKKALQEQHDRRSNQWVQEQVDEEESSLLVSAVLEYELFYRSLKDCFLDDAGLTFVERFARACIGRAMPDIASMKRLMIKQRHVDPLKVRLEEKERVMVVLSHKIKGLVTSAVIDPLELMKDNGIGDSRDIDDALRGGRLLREIVNTINESHAGTRKDFESDLGCSGKHSRSLLSIADSAFRSAVANMFDELYFNEFYAAYFLSSGERDRARAQFLLLPCADIDSLLGFVGAYLHVKVEWNVVGDLASVVVGNEKHSATKFLLLLQEIFLNAIKNLAFVAADMRKLSVQVCLEGKELRFEVRNNCVPNKIGSSSGVGMTIIESFLKQFGAKKIDYDKSPGIFPIGFVLDVTGGEE